MSGNFSPRSGQSLTKGKVNLPKSTSPDVWKQGYHIAPLRAGPSASAGISMNRRPAAGPGGAGGKRKIAAGNLREDILKPPATTKCVRNSTFFLGFATPSSISPHHF